MTARRLLALGSQSVVHAECSAASQWAVGQVLTGQDVRCLEVDPLNSQRLYAGTQGVFSSADGGRSWRPAGLSGVIVKALAASLCEPGVVYAGTKSPPLIYRTADAGAHREELTGFRPVRPPDRSGQPTTAVCTRRLTERRLHRPACQAMLDIAC